MIYRVYFWIRGVDPGRLGGPWWYQDFTNIQWHDDFIRTLKPRCHKIRLDEAKWLSVPSTWAIIPPKNAVEIPLEGEIDVVRSS